ncbi:c-type cytochrome [Sphingomonas jatrophae]|uniref:Cytochrome c n=1 Tax=Sphingomonas jatrophae TaxID=1166337 RepID=A0A1I6M578_9SPHN|nr:c-type cytochrome [Sphingomonas jatrophae]SFS10831.1 cytochrome c [Sphingomonas jatrophae]
MTAERLLAGALLIAVLIAGTAASALPPGDAAAGARAFAACAACHARIAGAPQRNGPALVAVIGKRAGAVDPGYAAYSPALKSAKLTWTAETLDAWLARPAKFVPGNRMAYPGMPDPVARANLIAFLTTPPK